MLKLLIVDDQKLLLNSLKKIIEHDQEITVVGCAQNGFEALEICNSIVPDVVLMDVCMPCCDGIEGVKLIKSKNKNIKVLMMSMIDNFQEVFSAMDNGADGYILKDITPEELIVSIKNIKTGFKVISDKAYEAIHKKVLINKENIQVDTFIHLKDDKIQLIRLIADGKKNREIAKEMYLSEGRVKNIITEILGYLKLKNRYELLSFAYKNKLID